MGTSTDGNRDSVARTGANRPLLQFSLQTLFASTVVIAALAAGGTCGGWAGFWVALLFTSVVLSQWALWRRRRTLARLCDVLFFGSLVGIVYCLAPSTGSREFGRRAICANNLKQLAMAVQEYESSHGTLPPPCTTDPGGNLLHSWRALILPYLGRETQFRTLRLDEPWNSPTNHPATQFHDELFRCPADADTGVTDTSYLAIVGPGMAWRNGRGVKLNEIKDKLSDTILLIEMHNSGIPWAEPRDLDLSNLPPGITKQNLLHSLSNHAGGFNAAFADGHAEFIPETIPWADFEAMLTIAGGERIDRSKW